MSQASAKLNLQKFDAIGTSWQIDFERSSSTNFVGLETTIFNTIEQFDELYSRFRSTSLVTKMSESAGTYILPPLARPLMDLYRELYTITSGAMTPVIGNLMSDAGYDANYSFKKQTLRPVPPLEDVLDYHYPNLVIKQPVILDVGAAGKGYLVDVISELIETAGIGSYVVDAGGDIRQRGIKQGQDRIGLEHPDDPSQVIGVASIGDRSICGSAGNRRSWQTADGTKLNHIMDPRSMQPANGVKALWTVADSTLLADGLSTALYFTDPAVLQKSYTFEYAILYDSANSDHSGLSAGHLVHSTNFPADFFK